MKRAAIIFCVLLLATVAIAQNPAPLTTIIDDFRGLVGGAPTNLPRALPSDIMNFDFHMAGAEGAPVALRKRSGFETVGSGLTGSTGGVYKWGNQLLASFGHGLYVYSTTFNDWRDAGISPLAAKCIATNGSDTVLGVYSAWWMPSMQTYDTLVIDGVAYAIRKIYSDSLIILKTVYGGATDTVTCYLSGGSSDATNVFDAAYSLKPGIVYGDSLYVYTATERVAYAGGQAAAFINPKRVDSVLDWRRSDMTLRLKGASLAALRTWVQVQVPKAAPPFNLALFCTEATPTYIRLRCDTNLAEKIIRPGYPYYATQLSASNTFAVICTTTVTGVDTSSVDAGLTPFSTIWEYARCTTRVAPYGHVNQYVRRTKTSGYHTRIYRFKVKTLADTTKSARRHPADTLTWMTTVGASNWADTGLYREQIPALRDSDAVAGAHFAISTIGNTGAVGVTGVDSSSWTGVTPGAAGVQSCGAVNCVGIVFPGTSGVRRTHGAVDWIIWSPHAKMGTNTGACDGPITYNGPYIDSVAVVCWGPTASPTPPATDGAQNGYSVGDSITLKKMVRIAMASLPSSVKPWAAWDWPIVTLGMDRLWLAGASGYPNLVTATVDGHPDTVDATTQVNVYDNDGSYITALWFDQNILYAGKSVGIFQIPIYTTTGAVGSGVVALEPAGCFPTRSPVGPLSQTGVTKAPFGWAFVGFDGVYAFDGSNSELISGPITDFWRDSLDATALSTAAIIYDLSRNRLLVSVTQKGHDANNTTLVYDLTANAWTRYGIAARFWSMVPYRSDNPVLYWGAPDLSSGRVCRVANTPADSGQAFAARWRSGWLKLAGAVGERTGLWEWMIEMKRSPNENVTLDVYRDGEATASHTGVIYAQNLLQAALDATASLGALTGDTLSQWITWRRNFPAGISAERFSFELQVIPTATAGRYVWDLAYGPEFEIPVDDSCEISALRIDHIPEGKAPW